MTFEESQSYLFSLGNEVSAMKLGLENIRTLLYALGKPNEKYLKIQVAGTNGKGSVCAILDSICREAGVRTGLYTSPHLISITERVKIDGAEISEAEFARIATAIREVSENLLAKGTLAYRPTFFEQMTAIALVAFSEANVKVAILETGLGGRFDATTAGNAEIAAITRIDLDHQEYLGETIEEIAAEKAAIIQGHTKAIIIGEQYAEAMDVIARRCLEFGMVPQLAERVRNACVSGRRKFVMETSSVEVDHLGLNGSHQIENAKIAILLAKTLKSSLTVTDQNITDGLENARHPGRLEYHGKFLFDGAHNIGGAKALAAYLSESEKRPVTLVFGAMRDKEIAQIASILFPLASKIVFTEPENSRALSYSELLEQIPGEITRLNVFASDGVQNALTIAETVTPDDGIILVTGSLYLVGEVKQILRSQI